jgi:hypothetical protein
MYQYQSISSNLNNIGLFTLISLISLLISRFYRGIENENLNKCFIVSGVCYLLFTLLIINFSLVDLCNFYNSINKKKSAHIRKWIFLFRFLLVVNFVSIFFILYIFIKKYYLI